MKRFKVLGIILCILVIALIGIRFSTNEIESTHLILAPLAFGAEIWFYKEGDRRKRIY